MQFTLSQIIRPESMSYENVRKRKNALKFINFIFIAKIE